MWLLLWVIVRTTQVAPWGEGLKAVTWPKKHRFGDYIIQTCIRVNGPWDKKLIQESLHKLRWMKLKKMSSQDLQAIPQDVFLRGSWQETDRQTNRCVEVPPSTQNAAQQVCNKLFQRNTTTPFRFQLKHFSFHLFIFVYSEKNLVFEISLLFLFFRYFFLSALFAIEGLINESEVKWTTSAHRYDWIKYSRTVRDMFV